MSFKLPGLISRSKSSNRQRLPDLGERELLVLETLWSLGEATAQTVQARMPDRAISLSTVQSTLERLHRKQLVKRIKSGRAYNYVAMLDRSQLICELLRDINQYVAAGDSAPMISGFLDYLADESPALADELTQSLAVRDSDEH